MKKMKTKELETERLLLKVPTIEEQKRLYEIMLNPEINKYYLTISKRFKADFLSWDKQQRYYENKINKALNGDHYIWSIFLKSNNECIGELNALLVQAYCMEFMSVDWYIDSMYQGNGYASEAIKKMLDYLFLELEVSGIMATIATVNIPSWKIMEKLRFTRDVQTKFVECTFVEQPVESYVYTLTKNKYLKKS